MALAKHGRAEPPLTETETLSRQSRLLRDPLWGKRPSSATRRSCAPWPGGRRSKTEPQIVPRGNASSMLRPSANWHLPPGACRHSARRARSQPLRCYPCPRTFSRACSRNRCRSSPRDRMRHTRRSDYLRSRETARQRSENTLIGGARFLRRRSSSFAAVLVSCALGWK